MKTRLRRSSEGGFTLIETMVALGVLTIGVLSIAQVMAYTLATSSDSGADLIAHEKATEAIESVFKARDTRTMLWSQIQNQADGGVFLNGPQPLRTPGTDGYVNTNDDGPGLESMSQPGPDGLLGTADDVVIPLSNYTRQITLTTVNQYLRRLQVTITYRSDQRARTFAIDTYISSFS